MKNKKQISIILLTLTLISCLYISKPSIEIESVAATIQPAAAPQSQSFPANIEPAAAQNTTAPAPDFTINSEGAILIDSKTGKILYGKNENEKLYPASTTKILTAIIAIENCKLTDKITASYEAVMSLPSGYSNAAIQPNETLTCKELLDMFLIHSANEVGTIFAEHISGSVENFAKLMNEEALLLGATNSHFVNAHGLHDEEHYTTVYDLYLIFQAALKNETFREICGSTSYTASYHDSAGKAVSVEWDNTMQYFTRNKIPPEGVTVLAGKTGTTTKALSCLALLSENQAGEEFISIILKSQDRGVLYDEMNDLLEEINK